MNKFLLILFLLISASCYSQDTIVKSNGELIRAKILEVDQTNVKYRFYSYPEGPVFTLPLYEISKITYEKGTEDVNQGRITSVNKTFETAKVLRITDPKDSVEYYMKGMNDASKNYRGYFPASTATFATSLVFSILGLVPAIVTSSTTPEEKNFGYRSPDLMFESAYNSGYKRKAKKIKQGKVWTAFAVGLVANLTIGLFIGIDE